MNRSLPLADGQRPHRTPAGTPSRTADRSADPVGRAAGALRLLIMRVPGRMAVGVIAAVSMTLSTLALLLFGRVSDTDIGPFLHQGMMTGIAVPIIVLLPFTTVAIRLIRDLEAERERTVANAGIDMLTGLADRRTIATVIARDLGLARRMNRQLTLALLDVDGLERINEAHGRAAGDALLCAVAAACDGMLRATDVVGRWGGDSFVIVLPDTGCRGAEMILERLREAIAELGVEDEAEHALSGTASIGAVTIDPFAVRPGAHPVQPLLAIAHRALIQAKAAGRNCVIVETLVQPPAAGGAQDDPPQRVAR